MSFILSPICAQRTLDLSSKRLTTGTTKTIPTRNVEKTDDGYLVTYNFGKVVLTNDELYPECNTFHIDGFGKNEITTEPSFLARQDMFAIPNRCNSQSFPCKQFVCGCEV